MEQDFTEFVIALCAVAFLIVIFLVTTRAHKINPIDLDVFEWPEDRQRWY